MEKITIKGKVCYITGATDSYEKLFIWPMGEHEKEGVGQLFATLFPVLMKEKCILAACRIEDWNRELSPWKASAVFKGKEAFSGEGEKTLNWLLESCIPHFQNASSCSYGSELSVLIGGYSLAGLFALWAFHETGRFHGVASCSGSLWYPGFLTYAKEKTGAFEKKRGVVFLSLGEKENKTANPVMSTVKARTEELYKIYESMPKLTARFEMNPGNHFTNPRERLVKGFKWLIEHS